MFIYFRCECGREFKADARNSGRKARCPTCRVLFLVPLDTAEEEYMPVAKVVERPESARALPAPRETPAGRDEREEAHLPTDLDDLWSNDPLNYFTEPYRKARSNDETKTLDTSYWSAFRYPLAPRARIMLLLATVMFAPSASFWSLMLALVASGETNPFILGFSLLATIPVFLIFAFFSSFCLSVIRDTRDQEDDAPDWPDLLGGFWDEMSKPALRLIAVAVISFLPFLICTAACDSLSLLLGHNLLGFLRLAFFFAGLFYFPMAVLSSDFFGGVIGANPVTVIAAIKATAFDYLTVVAATVGVAGAGLLLVMRLLLSQVNSLLAGGAFSLLLLSFPTFAGVLYLAMVASRMLGLLYRRNRDKLGWDCSSTGPVDERSP